MAYFRICFTDGKSAEYSNVSELIYVHDRKTVQISADLEKYPVPLGIPFWLQTANGMVAIKGEGISIIEVTAD